MKKRLALCPLLFALTTFVLAAVVPPASAEVTKVEVSSRTDIGGGYEQVVGRIHFAVDPKNPRNAVIADIDKAPRNAAGLVEFSSDFSLQRPISGGNGAALVLIDVRHDETRTAPGQQRAQIAAHRAHAPGGTESSAAPRKAPHPGTAGACAARRQAPDPS
jgi:hypothetical protein